jgi:hypothetical protein
MVMLGEDYQKLLAIYPLLILSLRRLKAAGQKMYEDVKICPECGAEYFAHVEECNGCGVRLLSTEEKAKMEKEAAEPASKGADESSLSRLREVAGALESSAIDYEIVKEEGPTGCSSKEGNFSLLVPKPLANRALKTIEDYWHRLHPEIKQAKEMLDKGLCPCCGSNVEGLSVCPDCGLDFEGPSGEQGV